MIQKNHIITPRHHLSLTPAHRLRTSEVVICCNKQSKFYETNKSKTRIGSLNSPFVRCPSSIFINPFYQRWHYCATTFNHSISIASCQLLSYIPKYRQNLLRSQAVTQVTSIFFCNNPVYVSCYLVFHYRRQPEPPILHSFARLCRLVPMLGLLLSFLPVIFRFYLLMPFGPLLSVLPERSPNAYPSPVHM